MPRVLVVDDEEQIRNLLRKILVRAGYEVHTAANARAAIEMCAPPAYYDLIISEVLMPGMDGHELARRLAVQCPESRVILMSGGDPSCEECPYLDNCQRLSKPFLTKKIVALVSDALARPARPRIADLPGEPNQTMTEQVELDCLRRTCSATLEEFIAEARASELLMHQFSTPIRPATSYGFSSRSAAEAQAYDNYLLASMRLRDFLLRRHH